MAEKRAARRQQARRYGQGALFKCPGFNGLRSSFCIAMYGPHRVRVPMGDGCYYDLLKIWNPAKPIGTLVYHHTSEPLAHGVSPFGCVGIYFAPFRPSGFLKFLSMLALLSQVLYQRGGPSYCWHRGTCHSTHTAMPISMHGHAAMCSDMQQYARVNSVQWHATV